MKLSILICTIPKRKDLFDRLMLELRAQVGDEQIEILWDDGEGTIGAKRQRLLERATGNYVAFIDDDDWISRDYIRSIMYGIESKPDAVGFMGWITTNGKYQTNFKISKDCEYKTTSEGHERFNNHLSPVKRSIALQIGYKDMNYGEDYDYAVRLKESGLIKTERFISKHLYFYRYVSRKTYT
jgi:glycosyltransferase involved in cell wall biosynthesis